MKVKCIKKGCKEELLPYSKTVIPVGGRQYRDKENFACKCGEKFSQLTIMRTKIEYKEYAKRVKEEIEKIKKALSQSKISPLIEKS